MKQGESVKLKESAKNEKKEPMDHHQSCYSASSNAVLAADSLELKLAYTAIKENTITHEHII